MTPFKDNKDGETHYFGDECMPPHIMPTMKYTPYGDSIKYPVETKTKINMQKTTSEKWKDKMVETYKDIPAGVMAMLIVDIDEIILTKQKEVLLGMLPEEANHTNSEPHNEIVNEVATDSWNSCRSQIILNAKNKFGIDLSPKE